MDLKNIHTWRDVASKYNVSEIRAVGDEVRRQADFKSDQLRSLVGLRFRDLLKTADTITEMESTMETYSSDLMKLYASPKRVQWKTMVDNLYLFDDPAKKIPLAAKASKYLAKLLDIHILRQLRHPKSYSTIARDIYLIKLLSDGISGADAKVKALVISFNSAITSALLEKDSFRSSSDSNPVDLMVAYTISLELPPEQCFVEFLAYRLKFITSACAHRTSSRFLESLKVISSTIYMYDVAFSKSQVTKVTDQQYQIYSLLEYPDLAEHTDIELSQVAQWLPENVTKARSIPHGCLQKQASIDSKKQIDSFIASALELLTSGSNELLSTLESPSELLNLYRELLLLFKDSRRLKLLTINGSSWIFSEFHQQWCDRFGTVLSGSVSHYANITQELRRAHKTLLNSTEIHTGTENIFNNRDVLSGIFKRETSKLAELFNQIEEFARGSIGTVVEFSKQLDTWFFKVASWKEQIEKSASLGTVIGSSSTDSAGFTDDDDDYEEYQQWKQLGIKCITEFAQNISNVSAMEIRNMYNELLKEMGELVANDANTTESVVYILRALTIFNEVISRLGISPDAASENIFNEGSGILATKLDLSLLDISLSDYKSIRAASWNLSKDEENGILYPTNASYVLLGRLMAFNDFLTGIVGHDGAVWARTYCVGRIREKAREAVEQSLRSAFSALEKEEILGDPVKEGKKEKIEEHTKNQQDSSETLDDKKKEQNDYEEGQELSEGIGAETGDALSKSKDQTPSEQNDTKQASQLSIALQLYADFAYVNNFFGGSGDNSFAETAVLKPVSSSILQHIKTRSSEVIESTSLLYQPIRLGK